MNKWTLGEHNNYAPRTNLLHDGGETEPGVRRARTHAVRPTTNDL